MNRNFRASIAQETLDILRRANTSARREVRWTLGGCDGEQDATELIRPDDWPAIREQAAVGGRKIPAHRG